MAQKSLPVAGRGVCGFLVGERKKKRCRERSKDPERVPYARKQCRRIVARSRLSKERNELGEPAVLKSWAQSLGSGSLPGHRTGQMLKLAAGQVNK